MQNQSQLQAWKFFLEGRIHQEEGKNDLAMEAFDSALKIDPQNQFFSNAKSILLTTTSKHEDAAVTQIKRSYAELAKKHTGLNDKPGPWVDGLKELLTSVDQIQSEGIRPMASCW